jgi:hypothetical protein
MILRDAEAERLILPMMFKLFGSQSTAHGSTELKFRCL